MKLLNKIRRFFNPTFSEWLEGFGRDYKKDLQEPGVMELLLKYEKFPAIVQRSSESYKEDNPNNA